MTYPTVSHFIESITGIYIPLPIQTFGFFIVLAFFVGQIFIKKELVRFEMSGVLKPVSNINKKSKLSKWLEFALNGIFAFFFGYKILPIINNYKYFSENPQDLILSSEGSLLTGILFFVISIIISFKNYNGSFSNKTEKKILPSNLSWNFIFVAAGSGIIGAKLFAVFEDIEYLVKDPIGAIFSFSGLTFYGGLIVGTICVIIYSRLHKFNISRIADIFAPSLILSYGVGRLGCHFSGDGDWGIVSNLNSKPYIFPDWMWSYKFPNNVIEAGVKINDCVGKYCYELPNGVYPTSLYEAIFGIIAFLVLWNLRKKIKVPGVLFSIYLILNGFERFSIETIRITEKYNIIGFSVTQAQVIGIILIFIGISSVIILKNKHKDELVKK